MLCPILHRDALLNTYEEGLSQDFRQTRSSLLALLSAVLALAGLSLSSSNTQIWGNEEANMCYRRAGSICRRARGRQLNIEIGMTLSGPAEIHR